MIACHIHILHICATYFLISHRYIPTIHINTYIYTKKIIINSVFLNYIIIINSYLSGIIVLIVDTEAVNIMLVTVFANKFYCKSRNKNRLFTVKSHSTK